MKSKRHQSSGSKGGLARKANLTPEERSAAARVAARARWARRKAWIEAAHAEVDELAAAMKKTQEG